MRVKSSVGVRLKRFLDVIVTLSMVLFSAYAPSAFAAGGLTNASVKLSDPRPDATTDSVTYTVSWKAGTTATLKCFTYKASTSSAMGQGSTPTGFSNANATNGTFTGLTAANWTIDNTSNGTVKETYTTGASVSSGSQITTPINSITNPTQASGGTYYVDVNTYSDTSCSTLVDSAVLAFTTTPAVLVSATVDSTLSFAVTGVAASTTYKGALSTDAKCTDTATAVSFGSPSQPLTTDTNYDCAQTLTTSTNSNGGYQVTVQGKQASGDFLKLDSDATKTITNWTGSNSSPTATATSGSSEQFAYTTNDSTLSGGTPGRFTAQDNLFAGLTTTADEVAYNSTAIANDAVNVGYRLRYTGTTDAGAYHGTLVYTCTPVF